MKNELFKENSKKIIETCDLLCKNTFMFNHKWHMEVCKVQYTISEENIWKKIPFEDH